MKKRPFGLTIFAVLNFIFVGLLLLSFLVFVSTSSLREQTGVNLYIYAFLSPLVTAGLLMVSGLGFLNLHYRKGFICGIVFCTFSLCNIVVFSALRGFEGFSLQMPGMIYPIVLLLMLTLRYRRAFLKDEITTDQKTERNAVTRVPDLSVALGVTEKKKILSGGSLTKEAVSARIDLKTREIARSIIGFNLVVGPILFIVGGLGFLVGSITLGYPIAAVLIFVGAYSARNYLSPRGNLTPGYLISAILIFVSQYSARKYLSTTGTISKKVAIAINSVALVIAGSQLISNAYKLHVLAERSRYYYGSLSDYRFFGVWLPLIPVAIVFGTLLFILDTRELNSSEPRNVNAKDEFVDDTSIANHKCYCEKCGTKVTINYGDAYTTLCKKCT